MKTEASKAKARATREAQSKRFKAQVIIGTGWKVVRLDEMNWQIRYPGYRTNYYGSLLSALQSIPAKLLNEAAENSLAGLVERLKAIQQDIAMALEP